MAQSVHFSASGYRLPSISVFAGGSKPRDLALAVALGLLTGLVTGSNLSCLAVLTLAALLNVPLKPFFATWAVGFGIGWLGEAVTYFLGCVVLDETPLGEWLGEIGDNPWLAMFDWDRYTLVGGAVLAVVVAVPAARTAWRWGVDKQPPTSDEAKVRGRVLRRWGLPLSAMVWTVGLLACAQQAERDVEQILAQISRANGAPVTARRIEVSPWTNKLELEELEIGDAANLGRDRLRVRHVTAKINPVRLRRGQLEITSMQWKHVEYDVAREQAAKALPPSLPDAKVSPLLVPDELSLRQIELHEHIKHWDQLRERLVILERLLGDVEKLSQAIPAAPAKAHARSELRHPHPLVRVDKLSMEELAASWGLGNKALVEIDNLVSQPAAQQQPTTLTIVAPDWAADCRIELSVPGSEHGHHVVFDVYNLPLASLIETAHGSRMAADNGLLHIHGDGFSQLEQLDVPLEIEAQQLSITINGNAPVCGISPDIWNLGLRQLGGLRAKAALCGRWSAPRVDADPADLAAQFMHQLRSAGEHELVAAVEEQLQEQADAPRPTPAQRADAEPAPSVGAQTGGPTLNQAGIEPLPSVDDSVPALAATAKPVIEPLPAVESAPQVEVAGAAIARLPAIDLPPALPQLPAAAADKKPAEKARVAKASVENAASPRIDAAKPSMAEKKVVAPKEIAKQTTPAIKPQAAPPPAQPGDARNSDPLFAPPPLAASSPNSTDRQPATPPTGAPMANASAPVAPRQTAAMQSRPEGQPNQSAAKPVAGKDIAPAQESWFTRWSRTWKAKTNAAPPPTPQTARRNTSTATP